MGFLVKGICIKKTLNFEAKEKDTLPETNLAPENWPSQEETIVFQPSIFRGELLVSGRVVFFRPIGSEPVFVQEEMP